MNLENEHLKALRETLEELKRSKIRYQDKLAAPDQADAKCLNLYRQLLKQTSEMIEFIELEFVQVDLEMAKNQQSTTLTSTASTNTVVDESTNVVDSDTNLTNTAM